MNDPEAESTPTGGPKSWIADYRAAACALALAIPTLLLAVTALLLFRKPEPVDPQEAIGLHWIKPAGTEAEYAGDETCRPCHASEFASHRRTPHSRTASAIPDGVQRAEFALKQSVSDEVTGTIYDVRQSGGKNQEVAVRGDEAQAGSAHWVFGSGEQAFTYLAQNQNTFLQMRISYYPPSGTWNFTPGSGPGTPVRHILGDPYSPVQAAACFGCHSTVLIGSRAGLDFGRSVLNVGCESCHGPSRRHAESYGSNAGPTATRLKPPAHTPTEIMALCGNCHRVPVATADQNSAAGSQLARFPGQALPRSRCFMESAGKLACTTCHNPHESTSEQKEASFEKACLSCHTAPHGRPCARSQTSGCILCHMPVEKIGRKLPLEFHNHWIRRDPHPAE